MRRISVEQLQSSERFYRVPKVFFEAIYYKKLSTDAKFTYSILKDRFELSLKNGWIDKEGSVYLIFTVAELQELLGYGNKKVIKLKKELAEYGLLEEVQQGLNRPNLLYLGNVESDPEILKNTFKPLVEAEVSKRHFQENKGNVKTTLQEMSKRHTNDTDISDTENINISSRESGADLSKTKFIPQEFYNVLSSIEEAYHSKIWINEANPFGRCYHLTHEQKMQIGQLLSEGYLSSLEVIRMIENFPEEVEHPFAYLMSRLNNLNEERRQETRILAHKAAERRYG